MINSLFFYLGSAIVCEKGDGRDLAIVIASIKIDAIQA
jgi:hypothetical protein